MLGPRHFAAPLVAGFVPEHETGLRVDGEERVTSGRLLIASPVAIGPGDAAVVRTRGEVELVAIDSRGIIGFDRTALNIEGFQALVFAAKLPPAVLPTNISGARLRLSVDGPGEIYEVYDHATQRWVEKGQAGVVPLPRRWFDQDGTSYVRVRPAAAPFLRLTDADLEVRVK